MVQDHEWVKVEGDIAIIGITEHAQELLGDVVQLDQLKFDVLNGHLLLHNVEVQPNALQRTLGLPLAVEAGMISRIELRIPWSQLLDRSPHHLYDG